MGNFFVSVIEHASTTYCSGLISNGLCESTLWLELSRLFNWQRDPLYQNNNYNNLMENGLSTISLTFNS